MVVVTAVGYGSSWVVGRHRGRQRGEEEKLVTGGRRKSTRKLWPKKQRSKGYDELKVRRKCDICNVLTCYRPSCVTMTVYVYVCGVCTYLHVEEEECRAERK